MNRRKVSLAEDNGYRTERKVCPRLLRMNSLHLRFDGSTCKEPVAKLILTLDFNFFFFPFLCGLVSHLSRR